MSKPKLLFLFLLIILSLLFLFPFLNGLGCNFTYQEKGEHVRDVGKCKLGILTSYYKSFGDSGPSYYNRYVYGAFGGYFYLVRINKERIAVPQINNHSTNLVVDDEHAFGLYDGDRFYISRYFCDNSVGECLFITDDSIENASKMIFHGRLGFF
ncbi:hypothetical protein [Aeromonas jandaei]|uniref:hypothetical protein n=1 Tax=Aeromonas jandaei TaxID=650 RepID=UPI003BA20113